jgi:hypothetical protein
LIALTATLIARQRRSIYPKSNPFYKKETVIARREAIGGEAEVNSEVPLSTRYKLRNPFILYYAPHASGALAMTGLITGGP